MSNWKELGEVPDSEEEDDFDSQVTGLGDGAVTQIPAAPTNDNDGDVWDVPLSQETPGQITVDLPSTVRRTKVIPRAQRSDLVSGQVWDVPLSQGEDELAEGHHGASSASSKTVRPQTIDLTSSPLSTLSSIAFEDMNRPSQLGTTEDEEETHVGRGQQGSAPSPVPSDLSERPHSPSPLWPNMDQMPEDLVGAMFNEKEEAEFAARQAAVRYQRSLRARKPIQQHPFLLEMAQYRNSMQSRGLKPVKIAARESERRQKNSGETQERDFEPESQDSQGGDGSGPSHELPSQMLGDMDDWALPSSSPPSPPRGSRNQRRSSPTSSRQETDSTSIQMDDAAADELPALEDLLLHPKRPKNKHTPKRRPTSPRTSTAKRQRRLVLDSDDIAPDAGPDDETPRLSQAAARFLPPSSSFEPIPDFLEARSKTLTEARPAERGQGSPSRVGTVRKTTVLNIDSDSESGDFVTNKPTLDVANESDGTASSSEGGEQIVNTVGRRIRGVLPASWLRLDQKSGRDSARKAVTSRTVNRSPEREPRRGVAQRRFGTTSTAIAGDRFWSDESDDERRTPRPDTTDEAFPNQAMLMVDKTKTTTSTLDPWLSDDPGLGADSDMEDNQVEPMLAPRKRQLKLSESFQGNAKRRKSPLSASAPRVQKKTQRQPKMKDALAAAGSSKSKSRVSGKSTKSTQKGKNPIVRGTRVSRAAPTRQRISRLSILDVVEPDAPRFLKIAARTARKRPNQGRSSPSRKTIRLANREDHVDALTVLHQWRAGSIPQRAAVTSSVRQTQRKPKTGPLSETSANIASRKQTRAQGTVENLARRGSNAGQKRTSEQSKSERERGVQRGLYRPAQLETSSLDPLNSRTFHSGKRALDRLFRNNQATPSIVDVSVMSDALDVPATDQRNAQRQPVPQQKAAAASKSTQKSRFRKQTRPVKENLEAPHIVHAHDPLPAPQLEAALPEPTAAPAIGGPRMRGLGPYGTRYTHHFEVFPLTPGVYFHESSLIGHGAVISAMACTASVHEDASRQRISYTLGDQTLRWASWSSQTSSEMGVLIDFIAEKLDEPEQDYGNVTATVNRAADFLLSYIKDHMSFDSDSDIKLFFTRFREIVSGFNEKLNVKTKGFDDDPKSPYVAIQRVLERILVAALCVLQVCRNHSSLISQQFEAEDLLKAVASSCISVLLHRGTADLRETYRALNSSRVREQGLREDSSTIHTWVTLMKTLDEARILRGSFWDLVQAQLSPKVGLCENDAEKYDKVWQDLFTFLPLVEFSAAGVLRAGDREHALHDGWALPQKLLKTVFQLYRDNTRQPPSFNNYCRALVGRCHYLVEHWGWRKSSGVIGVIFDFFGSQNLAHLRNEEVYKSPRFLDHLASDPCLEIEAEDRCFHVFLKLVALSIRQLRDIGATKDIRNLVARTMPNHSRQYLKEQNLHERDLAALRNHHDLLCTLFWACPPELRPSVALLEGLVDPGSSHKETCLINLRAWSQLVRYLVSNGEASSFKVFGPFVTWRDTFFSKTLAQYSSIGSEIYQQFHSLAKEEREGVSKDMLAAMITANKIAVQDVLHFSVTASHDVMRQCPDLEAAVWSLSTKQLQHIFDHFAAAPPDLDWSILTTTLKTLDAFLSKIEAFKAAEDSQRESQLLDSEQADDALQTLDECVAKTYFSMARCVLSGRGEDARASAVNAMEKVACKELIVTLSARFATRLVASGAMNLGQLFKYGKYGLFDAIPHKLDIEQRRYLVLCVLHILKANVDDFEDMAFGLLDVWLLAIVKPREGLCWENQLAEQLQSMGKPFVPEAAAALALQPQYHTNRDLFEFAVTYMRTSARKAESSEKKNLLTRYGATLKAVMEQMTSDLKATAHDAAEHPPYVSFVRDIISLIRSNGSELCAIDDFFYQISKDYSPPAEDPQLQVAGMLSYETKLDDPGAQQQLFFFMYNNFKVAMSQNKLGEESFRLWQGMKSPAIRRFVLGKMVPAAFQAAWQDRVAIPLVTTYVDAVELLLKRSVLSVELSHEDLVQVLPTLGSVWYEPGEAVMDVDALLFITNSALSLVNLLWPSLLAEHIRFPISHLQPLKHLDHRPRGPDRVWNGQLAEAEEAGVLPAAKDSGTFLSLLARTYHLCSEEDGQQITSFATNIITDIERNWTVTQERIGIKTPARGGSTQMATQVEQGIPSLLWDEGELSQEMLALVAEWREWWDEIYGGTEQRGDGDDEGPAAADMVLF
ncbi:mus7/MMS22 family protein [Sarocladium implicatum]|nr:mus7/MMS22 family protein [Sarocladium implicatum]